VNNCELAITMKSMLIRLLSSIRSAQDAGGLKETAWLAAKKPTRLRSCNNQSRNFDHIHRQLRQCHENAQLYG